MTRLFLIATLLLSWALPVGAAEKIKEVQLPTGLKLHEFRLANGLQLLVVPDSSAPVFSFQVWFKVGSADEKLNPRLHRTGLAHLFEHMMFRGTPRYPDQKFDTVITSAGAAENNATTWLDRTNYFESLPKERLELIFDVESDRMAHLALDNKLFKTELGAVFGELKMNKDKPMRVANDLLWDAAYDVHPYKYTTMGTPDELNSFKVEDAQYFYKTYYSPNNATVVVIGDVDVNKTVKLAEKYYGKYKSQEIPRPAAPQEPEQKEARHRHETHPLATDEIILIGYKIPQIGHADMPALEVAAAILAYGDGSLLEKALVQQGLAASVFASCYELHYPSLFHIGAQIAGGKSAKDIRAIIDGNLKRMQEGKISDAELKRARNQLLLNLYNEIATNNGLGDFLGEALTSSGDYMEAFKMIDAIKQVSLADIERVSKTYLVNNHSTEVLLSPEKGN